jgi:hypothetical protein
LKRRLNLRVRAVTRHTHQQGNPADAGRLVGTNRPLSDIHQIEKVFDPCANRPASGDFLSVMQDNLTSLRQAYKQGTVHQKR